MRGLLEKTPVLFLPGGIDRRGEVTQQGLVAESRVEDTVDCFRRPGADAVDDSQRPEHERLQAARFDQLHLVRREEVVLYEAVAERDALVAGLVQERL